MKTISGLAVIAILLGGTPVLAENAAATHKTTKVTTSNGKVTSATSTTQKASCRNDKGQFIKCSEVTNVSTMANITKDSSGKCRFSSGPKKGQFTKCP